MRVLYLGAAPSVHDRRFIAAYLDHGHQLRSLWLDSSAVASGTSLNDVVDRPKARQGAALDDHVGEVEAVLKAEDPDIVHAGPLTTCAWVAAMARPRRLIAASWGWDVLVDATRDPAARLRSADALSRADLVLCDSEVVCAHLRDVYAVPSDRIVRFPWGIDVQMFSPGKVAVSHRGRPGWEQACIVISSRHWEPQYGIMTIVDAFRRARSRMPDLRLVLLGSGSLEPRIRSFVQEHQLEPDVLIAGKVDNAKMAEQLRGADVYVTCSYSDGTSVSLLEAMGVGLPVVASDIAGDREWIGDGGYLVPVGDAEAVANGLAALASDAAMRRRMGLRNRQVVVERADWSVNVERLFDAIGRMRPRIRGNRLSR